METNPSIQTETTSPQKLRPGRFRTLPVRRLRTGRFQPRSSIDRDSEEYEQLKASIKAQGILNPLLVSRGENTGSYDLIGGERRLTAAQELGMEEVPVRDLSGMSEADKAEVALVDNLLRRDLNAYEVAKALHKLQEEYGYSLAQLAKRMGTTKSKIAHQTAILKAPSWLQEFCRKYSIGYSVAELLVRLSRTCDKEKVRRAAYAYRDKSIGRRELVQMYKAAKAGKDQEQGKEEAADKPVVKKSQAPDPIDNLVTVAPDNKSFTIHAMTQKVDQPLSREQGERLIRKLERLIRVVRKLMSNGQKAGRVPGDTDGTDQTKPGRVPGDTP